MIDSGLELDVEERVGEEPNTARRRKKPYRAAIARPATRIEALADEPDLFDLTPVGPSITELYIDRAELMRRKGTNGRRVVGTFNGCGGSTSGFTWAGWDSVMDVEFVKAARDTLGANYNSYTISPTDVYELVQRIQSEPEFVNLAIAFNRPTRARGEKIEPSVNWEKTLEEAAKAAAAGDEEPVRMANALRYRVTHDLLTEKSRDGAMALWGDDIRSLDPYALMDFYNIAPGELDCLEGSPPCKSFSTAGSREAGWGKVLHYSDERHQRTDDLFLEYVRLLTALRPKSFVAENVAGLGMGNAQDFLNEIITEMGSLGYHVDAKVINAKDYGVPQSRPRMIIIGIRDDLVDSRTGGPLMPQFPAMRSHIFTLEEALEAAGPSPAEEIVYAWLGTKDQLRSTLVDRFGEEVAAQIKIPEGKAWSQRRVIENADGTVTEARLHGSARMREIAAAAAAELDADIEEVESALSTVPVEEPEAVEGIITRGPKDNEERYETGVIWNGLKIGAAPDNKAFQLMRCHPRNPVPTITATAAGNIPAAGPCHPHEARKFTVNEYRWLFSFPHDYVFTGNLEQQGERMGRSVPPFMMYAISAQLDETLSYAVES